MLVTGGAGYIGSHTVRALREAGRDVVVLDSLELGRREAVIDATLVVGNITDQDLVAGTCNEHGVTQVVHFAASSPSASRWAHRRSDYDTPDGTCIRDYIHVEDLADAHVKALDYLSDGGDTTAVNLGTGEGSSVLDVINTTSATFADPTFAQRTLGWTARQGLEEIVRSAYAWHVSQLELGR